MIRPCSYKNLVLSRLCGDWAIPHHRIVDRLGYCALSVHSVEKDRGRNTLKYFSSFRKASPIRSRVESYENMIDGFAMGEVLLLLGGALIALGAERLYWSMKPPFVKMFSKRRGSELS